VHAIRIRAALFAPCLVLASALAGSAELTDAELAKDVSSELATDEWLAGAGIEVSVRDGIVTLTGELPALRAKDHAAEVAELVRGVRAVVNRIRVKAPPIADSTLKTAASRAISALRTDVQLTVDAGTVILEGSIPSLRDRLFIEETVKTVLGVRALDSRLTIDSNGLSDEDLEAALRALLAWDSRLESGEISVKVEERNVTLEGTVRSAADKSRAIRLAGLPGVESIDASQVQVELGSAARLRPGRAPGDGQLRKAIEDALFYDPRVRGFQVDVRVEDGVATLEGEASSLRARIAAEDDAASVTGVRGVVNQLSVRPPSPRSDRDIEAEVALALEQDPAIEREDIVVLVLDGKVRLEGSLETGRSKDLATEVVSSIEGVVEVENEIQVVPPEFSSEEDEKIRDRIEGQLRRSTIVDASNIQVRVENGKATLTGEVRSVAALRSATREAFQGGAILVANQLEVRNGERLEAEERWMAMRSATPALVTGSYPSRTPSEKEADRRGTWDGSGFRSIPPSPPSHPAQPG
jgi:osmotically-inducible protein OsmY